MNEYPISTYCHKADYLSDSDLKILISQGEYLKAYDLGDEYLRETEKPDHEIVKQHALCMSKLGMIERAIKMLQNLKEERKTPDPELFALLGSFYKRQWLKLIESDPHNAEPALDSSFRNYMESRELSEDFWYTVNAASLALILGKRDLSVELADEVIAQCWDIYNKHGTTSEFWVPASMGEAYLIKGDYNSAARWYKGARSHLGSSIGQIKTTRTNAKMLLDMLETDHESADEILECIRKPRIAIFAGHRIDRPGRTSPRFPENISGRIKKRLKKKLIEMKLDIGIASAADGADILFHECLQNMGKRTHVILPSPIAHFRNKLVEDSGEDWANRFDRIIENADRIEISSFSRFESHAESIYTFCTDFMLGTAFDMCKAFNGELVPIVVWDGKATSTRGGTSYIISRLHEHGYEPIKIPLKDLVGVNTTKSISSSDIDEDFPYRNLGIYKPEVRSIVALSTKVSEEMEERNASRMNLLSSVAFSICENNSIRILNCGCLPGRMHLLFKSISDAMLFSKCFIESNNEKYYHSLILHAGIVMRVESSLKETRDFYCKEIEEALNLLSNINKPSAICTMQAKALAVVNSISDLSFLYRGRLKINNENLLKVFEMSI